MKFSFRIALIAGPIWIMAATILYVRLYILDNALTSASALTLLGWVQAIDRIAFATFLVSSVVFVLLWMRSPQHH
jgi:hypothetical protein